jgi:hypothetical protein
MAARLRQRPEPLLDRNGRGSPSSGPPCPHHRVHPVEQEDFSLGSHPRCRWRTSRTKGWPTVPRIVPCVVCAFVCRHSGMGPYQAGLTRTRRPSKAKQGNTKQLRHELGVTCGLRLLIPRSWVRVPPPSLHLAHLAHPGCTRTVPYRLWSRPRSAGVVPRSGSRTRGIVQMALLDRAIARLF